uniref:Uncharacterized protein n=1 Tax=Parastrongyloides trichosuri TaxID=131310 RepID=A0A0N5A507_PARTI
MNVHDLVNQIFLSRSNQRIDDILLCQIELLVRQGYPIYIHTLLKENDNNILSIEVFSIHLTKINEDIKALSNIFLKNALNSYLYFSQFNSWRLSKFIPSNIKCKCRISMENTLSMDIKNCVIEEKKFPLTNFNKYTINMSVRSVRGFFPNEFTSKYPVPSKFSFNSIGPDNSVAIFGNDHKLFNKKIFVIGKNLLLDELIRKKIDIVKMPKFSHLIIYLNEKNKYVKVSLIYLQTNN